MLRSSSGGLLLRSQAKAEADTQADTEAHAEAEAGGGWQAKGGAGALLSQGGSSGGNERAVRGADEWLEGHFESTAVKLAAGQSSGGEAAVLVKVGRGGGRGLRGKRQTSSSEYGSQHFLDASGSWGREKQLRASVCG